MGKILFIFIALIFCYNIIVQKNEKKLYWYFAGILLFPSAILISVSPLVSFERLIMYTLLYVYLTNRQGLTSLNTIFPFKIPMIILFVLLLCVGIFDSRIVLFQKFYRPIIYYLESFFVFYLTYTYLRTLKDFFKVVRFLLNLFLVFALYGLFNYAFKTSPYHDFIFATYGGINLVSIALQGTLDERSRISSFVWHPIYYGFLLSVAIQLMLFVQAVSSQITLFSRRRIIMITILLVSNLLLVNSRTPIAALAVGLLFSFIFSASLASKFKIIFGGAILILIIMTFVPNRFDIIEKTANVFTSKSSQLAGSSIEMRETQLLASLFIFYQQPLTGNGYNYIQEDLGFTTDVDERNSDSDFEGFESYGYKLLIEQGLCGIVGNLILFTSLITWLIRKRATVNLIGKKLIILGIAFLCTFFLFIFGTGDMRSFPVFMSIMGIIFKAVSLCIKNDHLTGDSAKRPL